MINTQHIHTTKIEGGFLWVRYNPEGQWFQVEPEELLTENKLLKNEVRELEYRVSSLKADLVDCEDVLSMKEAKVSELEQELGHMEDKLDRIKKALEDQS